MYLTVEEARKKFHLAIIGEGSTIGKGSTIRKDAIIGQGSTIEQGATIGQGSTIRQGAIIGQGAFIGKGATIEQGATIGQDRKNVKKSIVISSPYIMGETGKLTGFNCDDGLIITCGCFNDWRGGTPGELREAVISKYGEDHFYISAINLIENWFKKLGESK